MATEKITIKLVLDSSGYKRGASQASSATDQIKTKVGQTNSTFSKLSGTLGKIGPALVGVFAAKKIFQAAGAAIGRAEAMASAYAITEQVIKQTGGAANITADQIKKLSLSQALLTGIDKELITQSNNVLLTFKNIKNEVGESNDVFNQASALVLDMATVMGSDAKSGAIQLGKALNDPILGVTALNRVGIQFTEQQKEQIKVLQESGDTLGAQKIILAELEGQLGGTAAAAADTTKKIKVAFQEAQETIGVGLLAALEDIAPELMDIAAAVGQMGPLFATSAKVIIAAIKPIIGWLLLVSDGITAITALWDESARAALRFSEAAKGVKRAQDEAPGASFFEKLFLPKVITDRWKEGETVIAAYANGLVHLAQSGALTTENLMQLGLGIEFVGEEQAIAIKLALDHARANDADAVSVSILEDALLQQVFATQETTAEQDALIEKFGLTDAAARLVAEGIDATGDAADGAEGPVDEFGNALASAEEEAEAAESALKSYLDLLAGLVNPALKAVNSLKDLEEAVEAVAHLERDGKTDTDEYRLAQLELAAQVFETEAALREFDGGNVETTVLAIAEALDIDAVAARELLEELGLLDGLKVTTVVDTEFTTSGSAAAQQAGMPGLGGVRQHGGPAEAGVPLLVGEAGVEIFIPASAGRIVSNAEAVTSGRAIPTSGDRGGDVNLTINNPIAENVEDDTRRGIQTASFLRGAN